MADSYWMGISQSGFVRVLYNAGKRICFDYLRPWWRWLPQVQSQPLWVLPMPLSVVERSAGNWVRVKWNPRSAAQCGQTEPYRSLWTHFRHALHWRPIACHRFMVRARGRYRRLVSLVQLPPRSVQRVVIGNWLRHGSRRPSIKV